MAETPSGAPRWKRDDPEKDAEIGHCNKARHSLSQLKYKMLQDAADWADSVRADEHEKLALRDFSDLFSRAIEDLLKTAGKVGDAWLQADLLADIERTTTLATSLGNFASNPFLEWRRLAANKNAKRTQTARAPRTEAVAKRRATVKPILLRDCKKHPGDDWTAGERAGRILPTVADAMRKKRLRKVSAETIADDIKAILALENAP
jgi:hypothetical protein